MITTFKYAISLALLDVTLCFNQYWPVFGIIVLENFINIALL